MHGEQSEAAAAVSVSLIDFDAAMEVTSCRGQTGSGGFCRPDHLLPVPPWDAAAAAQALAQPETFGRWVIVVGLIGALVLAVVLAVVL